MYEQNNSKRKGTLSNTWKWLLEVLNCI